MNVVKCSVDTCNHEASTDVWTDDDTRAFLCDHHTYVSQVEDWVVFEVSGGKTLMRDTAGSWFYIPERDEGLQALARNLGVAGQPDIEREATP